MESGYASLFFTEETFTALMKMTGDSHFVKVND
jgi:hypothetical protein